MPFSVVSTWTVKFTRCLTSPEDDLYEIHTKLYEIIVNECVVLKQTRKRISQQSLDRF